MLMSLFALPIAVGIVIGLALVVMAYRRGRIAYSAKATRREKNFRHVVTVVVFGSGLLLGWGLNAAGVMSDHGWLVFVWLTAAVFLGRSIVVELGIRRIKPDVE